MSSSPAVEPSSPSTTTPSSPALRAGDCGPYHTSTPNYTNKKNNHSPWNVVLPAISTTNPPTVAETTLTPPPRSPGAAATPASGDGRGHPPDGTSSDKSSETAAGVSRAPSTALSRKESYKAQRQHYRREKKRAASALLHSIEDPTVVVLADWLKVRGSLKSWTKLWCVLKPGILLLYKSPKAKSSHWVGTVLLTSCRVIERPSKKDGFCFKLYHPLEQNIWAPRGPHNETIGAVVQPLPTAHLIFRAPSQAAGHCWLDGLELALQCSNAMLRCSRSRPEQTLEPEAPAAQTNISHEELERHFNEHAKQIDASTRSSPIPIMIHDNTPNRCSSADPKPKKSKSNKTSRWTQFIESIEILAKDNDTSDSQTPESDKKDGGFLDFLKKKETSERNIPTTELKSQKRLSKSLASSPLKLELSKKTPILKYFDLPKTSMPLGDKEKCLTPSSTVDDNLSKTPQPKRRSSTPSTLKMKSAQKRISALRESGAKTDSENDDCVKSITKKFRGSSEIICDTSNAYNNIVITKTAPSIERFRETSTSSTDDCNSNSGKRIAYRHSTPTNGKFSLINYAQLPSTNFEALKSERRDERYSSQRVYVTGKVLTDELASAASDTDSEGSRAMADAQREDPALRRQDVLARVQSLYVEDPDREIGVAGELVEEVAEENKSLLWFLLKQVRPGMDLSKVVLPTFILEPRSFLDKLSDNYYHADILGKAQTLEDPYQRFKCVLRWYLSGLYRKPKGLKKPYNPVLGEIFRCCWRDKQGDSYTYYVAEQVSHHPPVSAFYVSNRKDGYVIEGSLLARSKFYGNSTSAILEGCARVHLLNWGETYITTAPYAHCKGIVIGTLSMELGGKVHIICQDTGYQADVEFKLRSFLGGADQTNAISGRIKKGKDTIATVDGYWDGRIEIKDKRTGEESNLLDVSILKEQRMPRYLMRLDHQQEFESQKLWLKVSEAILNDDQVAATEQKTIIEEAQRARARNLLSPWVPRLFRRDSRVVPEGIIDQGWRYNHANTSPWQPEEIIEFEEEFVISSALRRAERLREPPPPSDSDSRDELARRSKTSTRTLKQALIAIDTSLREQSITLERLTRTVELFGESQRVFDQVRPVPRPAPYSHAWDMFAGFILAMLVQVFLNWLS